MSEGNYGQTLAAEDSKRLELSYKLLYSLQQKNLAFLNALDEFSAKTSGRDGKKSRLAFIVTPLMVNHYNHMHHVYRASMYGKVPDLCDQTGGIMCTDLGALREELASRTTDVNRSVASTFRTATLPNVQFDFKAARDNVVETAIRMLDSIEIKQPDLTHSIRDDYIQNVRAIQESLTNALEKSRERTAELQSRLNEALRKLKSAERLVASVPDDTDRLHREIFKLKEQMIKQQALVLEQRVEYDSNTLRLRESQSECNLLRELMKRIDDQTKEGADSLNSVRQEMRRYADVELEKLRAENRKVQEELAGHVRNAIERSKQENEDTVQLCRSLMSGDAKVEELNSMLTQSREYIARLENENAELKQRIGRASVTADTGSSVEPMDYEIMSYANVAGDVTRGGAEGDFKAVVQDVVNRYNQLLMVFKAKCEYCTSTETRLKETYAVLKSDMESLYAFFMDPENIDASVMLAGYLIKQRVELKSEYSNLHNYLTRLVKSGRATENQSRIETLSRTIGYSEQVIQGLLRVMDIAYTDLADVLNLDRFPPEKNVLPETITIYFERRFGKGLMDRINLLNQQLSTEHQRSEDLEREKTDLESRLTAESVRVESNATAAGDPDALLNGFDSKPILFEEILQRVWARDEKDRLHRVLDNAYTALALDRVTRYETFTTDTDLKLYNLVEYTVLTDKIKRVSSSKTVRTELVNPALQEEGYFLKYFLSQLGNVQVENYINTLELSRRNQLAMILFSDYYVPVVNKSSFVMSIEGPFANFNMVYKV